MEHHFDLNIVKEYGIDVSHFIESAGWEGYFSEPISVYLEWVREFWNNPEVTTMEIRSRVVNMEVIVSEATISTAINCDKSGLTQEDNWEANYGGLEVILDILMKADCDTPPQCLTF